MCIRDSIVTDPVFLEIEALSYYDSGARATRQAPLLILRQGGVNEDADPGDSGYYYNRYGLAAMDGAWYTGLAYSALICQSELGALMFETGGDVVMIGLDLSLIHISSSVRGKNLCQTVNFLKSTCKISKRVL